VRGGVQLHPRFGVELEALRAPDLSWSQYLARVPSGINAHTTFDVAALQTSAVGTWSWGPMFDAYLQAGLALYDVDGRQVIDTLSQDAATTRAVSDGGSDLLLGVGIRMNATPRWAVRLDYQTFGIDGDFLGSNEGPTLDTLSVGVDYRFGKGDRGTGKRRSRDKAGRSMSAD
jgi:opacity protein-like surface antigen